MELKNINETLVDATVPHRIPLKALRFKPAHAWYLAVLRPLEPFLPA